MTNDTLLPTLFVQKLSRDFTKFPANPNWNDLKFLEKSFLNKYPNLKEDYESFKKSESKKWGVNFKDSFQKHSLALFVLERVDKSEYYY